MDHYTPFSPGNGPETPPGQPPLKPENTQAPEVADTEDDEPSRVEYLKNMLPSPKPRKKRKWLPVVLAVVVLAALAGGGYWWYSTHHKSDKPIAHKSATNQLRPAAIESSTAGTPQYVSNGSDLNLKFNYPSNWAMSPASNNNSNDQTITATSPLTTITTAAGSSVTGKVVVSIRPGTSSLDELNGTTTAAQASVQFAYQQPTADQYQYPYLTFIHTPSVSGVSGSFNEVLVSGTSPFPQDTNLTQSSIEVDPIIGANFYSCSTQTCTSSSETPIAITNNTWLNSAVFQQTLAIFQSMQLN
jgi:hypothetical protein